MTQRTQFDRSYTTGVLADGAQPDGTPFVNFPDRRLQVHSPSGSIDLLAIRVFSEDANYATNDIVGYDGKFYAALAPVTKGPFNPADWSALTAGQFDEIIQGVGWDFTIEYDADDNPDLITFIKDPLRITMVIAYDTNGDPVSIDYLTSTDSGSNYTPVGTLTLGYTDSFITSGIW